MIYVKKMDVLREVSEIMGIYEDNNLELAHKHAIKLKEADEYNNDCTWSFMVDNSQENTKSWDQYRREIAETLVEEGEITEKQFQFLELHNFNFFKLPGNEAEILSKA